MSVPRPYDRVKRLFDVVLGTVLLLLTAPIQLGVALLIVTKLGRPVLFRQRRPGKDGRVFTLVKFRTMRLPDPDRGLTSDADRLTPFGRRLRATSLDELPTLWNVVRGDMSLVGPRPLLEEYLSRYTPAQARRHEVRPGVTGLAQVRGRNGISWEEKFALDVEYVDRRSFAVDARLLAATIRVVLSGRGITSRGSATTPKFGGEHVR